MNKVFGKVGVAAIVTLMLAAAPAQAQVRGDALLGAAIAAQGNQALQVIRAEVRDVLRSWTPQVEAPRPAATPVVRHQAGAVGPAAMARCAE